MRTIYKYPLAVTDEQILNIPTGARALTVQIQHYNVCLWVEVDSDMPKQPKTVWIVGTGNPMVVPEGAAYVGTFQLQKGDLVFHVFTDIVKYQP